MQQNDELLRQRIAENIAFYRKRSGDTQAELAAKLNYSDKSVSKWERGDGTPDIFILNRIADLYHIQVQDLLREKKVPKEGRRHLLITLLAVGLVWLVATVLFSLAFTFRVLTDHAWLVFIYATAVSGIVCEVFSALWWNRLAQLVSCTFINWGVGLSLVLSLRLPGIVYIVCAVLEVLLILFFLLKLETYWKKKKNKEDPAC
ncbi:MAG: helix-turn-helix domain-containing protein [Oscillospiraceae bacterium]|nr:helix-turn-helix domain-containing protein [Oscillospiraceae bacterium]